MRATGAGMKPLESLTGLPAVADAYDVLLCDIWGVVHNGVAANAEACAALARFRVERGPVVLISNAPRPAPAVVEQFEQIGVPDASWSAVVTSGDATRAALRLRGAGPAWAIGPARDAALYEGLPLVFSDTIEQAAFVVCTGPFDDEVETPEDYRERFERAVARRLAFLCANPDRVVQRGTKMIPCAGALADLYEALGGEVVMVGKPHPPIYDLALDAAARERGGAPDRARVLCIGDGAPTDVRGANDQGLDCLFIGAGIHAGETLTSSGRLDPERAAEFLDSQGLHARYAMAELTW